MAFLRKNLALIMIGLGLLMSQSYRVLAADIYFVKSLYIYNFIMATEFYPALKHTITICTIGDDHFGTSLDKASEKLSSRYEIIIKRGVLIDDIPHCNALFVGSSEAYRLEKIFFKMADLPILSISEIKDFVNKGGIIEFRDMRDGKIGFAVNIKTAKQLKLKFDPGLLELAVEIVH
ncbi:MAG: YfiR family protein [Alphaproteobacteria bacterium]|nr:YfiR family protein [Alphaproteobacteria bacterium]